MMVANALLILLQLGLFYTSSVAADCEEPAPVSNAYRTWDGGEVNTWIRYVCMDGYKHVSGDLDRQCLGSNYTGAPPVCLLDCGPPLNYSYALRLDSNTMSDAVINFTCLTNYTQTMPTNTMECNAQYGLWRDPVYCAASQILPATIHYQVKNVKNSVSRESVEATTHATQSVEATTHATQSVEATTLATQSVEATTHATQSVEATTLATQSVEATIQATQSVEATTHATQSVEATIQATQSVEAATHATQSAEATLHATQNSVISSYMINTTQGLSTTTIYNAEPADTGPSAGSDSSGILNPSTDNTLFAPVFSSTESLTRTESSVWSTDFLLNNSSAESGQLHSTPSLVYTSSDQFTILLDTISGSSDVVLDSSSNASSIPLSSSLDQPSSQFYSTVNASDGISNTTLDSKTGSVDVTTSESVVLSLTKPYVMSETSTFDAVTARSVLTPTATMSTVESMAPTPDPCPEQDKLLVKIQGGPYEIIQVVLVGPKVDFVYNFKVEVYVHGSSKQYCYSKWKFQLQPRNLINCTGDRLFPIGDRVLVSGSFYDNSSLKFCDVEVYGRIPEVDCGTPSPQPGRRVVFNETVLGRTAKYYCETESGYHYRGGSQLVTCQDSGYWEDSTLSCLEEEKLDANVSGLTTDILWTDGNISTCAPMLGSFINLTFDLLGEFEIKMVTVAFAAYSATSVTITVEAIRNGQSKVCSIDSYSEYHHQPGETTIAASCPTAPVANKVQVVISDTGENLCEIKVFGRPYSGEGIECLQTSQGYEYKGILDLTVSGVPCSSWVDQTRYGVNSFPDMSLVNASNYCRNPYTSSGHKPWCYTDTDTGDWQECPIVACDSLCMRYPDGSSYSGAFRFTETENECMKWTHSPVAFELYALFPGGWSDNSNCRNPLSSMLRPWCYTDSSLAWEYCNIPQCPIQSEYILDYLKLDHHGVLQNLTDSGFTECFMWIQKGNQFKHLSNGTELETYVMQSCASAYTLNMTLLCSTDNTEAPWVLTTLECVDCKVPPTPRGMVVSYTSTFFPSDADYSCAAGFVFDGGTGNFTCLGTGVWDNATLVCKIDCGNLTQYKHTAVVFTETKEDSIATYTCLLTNETSNVTCLTSGSWELPTWSRLCIDCGTPAQSRMLLVTNNGTMVDDVAMYECDAGYVDTGGSNTSICQASGVWTTPSMICLRDCGISSAQPDMVFVPGGGASTTRLEGDSVSYACASGFRRTYGTGVSTCQDTGSWSTPSLVCTVDCGLPPNKTNMDMMYNTTLIDGVASYECTTGYAATSGTGSSVCQSSGQWALITLQCAVDCGVPVSKDRMNLTFTNTVENSTARYTCKPGYLATGGSETSICQTSGLWLPPTLQCEVDCDKPPSILNMNFTFTDTIVNSTALYACAVGYIATSGSSTVICQDSGTWTSPSLVCTEVIESSSSLHSSTIFAPTSSQPSSSGISTSSLVTASSVPSSTSTSAPSTTTTSFSSASPPTRCSKNCICGKTDWTNIDIEKIKAAIKRNLLLNKDTLSKSKRERVSAPDDRPTAQAMGHSSWVLLLIFFSVLLLSDVLDIARGVVSLGHTLRRRTILKH